MKILALLGSPKKEYSVTLQYLKFAQKTLPNSDIEIEYIGAEIPTIEKHSELFDLIVEKVKNSDAILWAFPVFFLHVPGQLLRFIDLVESRGAQAAFSAKYATAFSTSVHFHDNIPHGFLQAISEDWHMKYFDGYSADMDDLFASKERDRLALFFKDFEETIKMQRPIARRFDSLAHYEGQFAIKSENIALPNKKSGKKIVIVTDATEQDRSLLNMISHFSASSENAPEIVNINSLNLIGGCRECYLCTEKGHCSLRDDIEGIYREKIISADAIIFAPRTVGRYVSGRFKEFIDRGFFNGHRRYPKGIQAGYLISAPLRSFPDYRYWLESLAQHGCDSALLHIVTDEDSGDETQANIVEMARRIDQAILIKASKPPLFPAVGGQKVLRDLVFSTKFIFREDYRYYKKNGMLDYPHNNMGRNLLTTFLYHIMGIPGFRKAFERKMHAGQIAPYRKALEK